MSTKKKEYEELIEEIEEHDRNYYLKASPVISDYTYDHLMKRLEEIEREHPEWVLPNSPSQRVNEMVSKGFVQVPHRTQMLSLANTYSQEELEEFIRRIKKLLGKSDIEFYAELKMDGVAISVLYEKGVFVQALTRGDGKKGDDITANLKTIRSLPLLLKGPHIPEVVEIRGEVFMSYHTFQRLNVQNQEEGKEPWANPRNAAAGSLKLLDSRETAKRYLCVVFYGLADEVHAPVKTQHEVHKVLKNWGLPVFAPSSQARCKTIEDIVGFAKEIEKGRQTFPFAIDGIVIKVDQLKDHDQLGSTGKSPRWAVAISFPEQTKTRLCDITVQVGRTGVLTPVAELEPVFLAGSKISRATLHNQEEIARKDIRVGDVVLIEKGGDVIPKVVSVDKGSRPSSSHVWKMPSVCPSCATPIESREGEVAVRCPNTSGCPEQRMRRLIFFASKDAMDIEHLGEKVIEQLFYKKLVRNLSDLYTLDKKDLEKLDGFREKSIDNLLKSIDHSRHTSLERFLMALGIKHIGEVTAQMLSEHFHDLKTLSEATEEELLALPGIGQKMAKSVVSYFQDRENIEEIHLLLKNGVNPKAPPKIAIQKGHLFSGKTFVLTGSLSKYTREVATQLIKERGGKVVGSVSRNTDYVLVGEDPGSKLDKARELNVEILSEEEFEKLI